MPYVIRLETKALDLPDCGHLLTEFRLDEAQEKAAKARVRIRDIAQSKTGINKHEALLGLDEQAMTTQVASLH
jgi:hypothetical protein